jgi:hypothetical protein
MRAFNSTSDDMAVEGSLESGRPNTEPELEDEGTVAFLYKHAGARALVGLEFFLWPPRDLRTRRVRVDKLNRDGDSYQVTDVHAQEGLVRAVFPGELSVGLATRKRDEPLIKLPRSQLKCERQTVHRLQTRRK